MDNRKNILVIASHPDDEVLGCGGTIPKLVDNNNSVFAVILGEGITSRFSKREDADPGEVQELATKTQKISEFLGIKRIFHFDFPDNRFDTVPLLEIIKQIEKVISDVRPHTIFTHHKGDLNIDHMITHRAVLTASRPQKNDPVKEIYSFEVPSATEWSFGQFGSFRPNVFMDIEQYIGRKIEALKMYDTEINEFPHPRSGEAIMHNAGRWGSAVNLKYAEAFETIRRIL